MCPSSAAVTQPNGVSTGPEVQRDGAGLPAVRGFRWCRGQNRDRATGSHQDHFPRQETSVHQRFWHCKHTEMVVYRTEENKNRQSWSSGAVLTRR